MKQEQRLVAEVFRYLAPFMDSEKEIYVSLDGQAAVVGVRDQLFKDPTLPDLWFSLVGAPEPLLIEAKALDSRGRVLLMQSQLQAWRSGGRGAHKPQLWIAVTNNFDRFLLWEHSMFLHILDTCQNQQETVSLSLPQSKREFTSMPEFALAILRRSVLDKETSP